MGSYIKKNLWLIVAFAIVIVSALLLSVANTYAYMLEDFEAYSTGTINGQGSWKNYPGSTSGEVSTTDKYQGTKSFYHNGSKSTMLSIATTSELFVNFWIKMTGSTTVTFLPWYGIGVGGSSWSNEINFERTDTNHFKVRFNNGKGSIVDSYTGLDMQTWYYFQYSLRSTDDSLTIKITGEDSITYTNFYDLNLFDALIFNGNGYAYIDNLNFSDNEFSYARTAFCELFPEQCGGGNLEMTVDSSPNTVCYVGDICYLSFTFNEQAVGANVYIVPYADPWTNKAVASTTIASSTPMENNVIIPYASSTAPELNYCFLLEKNGNEILKCNYFLNWWTWEEWETWIWKDCTKVCDDVATSTGIFDEMRYGFECGMKKSSCWAFNPATSTLTLVQKTITGFNANFPLSVIYQLKNTFNSLETSTTTYAAVPVLTSLTSQYNLPDSYLISKTQYDASPVKDIWETVTLWIGRVFILLTVLYVIRRLFYKTKV